MTIPDVLERDQLDTLTVAYSSHPDRTNGLCAMEIVSWLAGEPHSDHPACTCPVIGAFLRSWNDGIKDDETRTRLIRPLLPLVLNTRSTQAVELTRSHLALDWLAREHAPAWLSLTDSLKAHAVALRGLAPLTDAASCRKAEKTLVAARAAAWDAARDAARAAAWGAAAAWAAARAAAWDAARDAARAAARAAAWDAARDAARAAAWGAAAAWAAAGAALAPTVLALQVSAGDLVRRMVAVGEAS